MSRLPSQIPLSDIFNTPAEDQNNAQAISSSADALFPISFRVTAEEKQRLKDAAGKHSISAYVRQCLFGDQVTVTRRRKMRKPPEPALNAVELARVLGTFGQSEMATHILALSMMAQAGELEVTPEVSDKLERACDDIEEIRLALMMALGMQPRKG